MKTCLVKNGSNVAKYLVVKDSLTTYWVEQVIILGEADNLLGGVYAMPTYNLMHGDNREQLKHLADNSIDSIVCDPPYELGFMGKRWDSTGIAYDVTVWTECLRVLKPGGHLIAFGGTRTYHRMTVAIEDAGFEIRDCIMWLYGSGFPKSHDVSKALDKQVGAEREVVGKGKPMKSLGVMHDDKWQSDEQYTITAPATDLAKQWHGWGTALKPAVEPAVLARKPLIGTVADNVTTWGVGGINIDECRVGTEVMNNRVGTGFNFQQKLNQEQGYRPYNNGLPHERAKQELTQKIGRWPANVIIDESAGEALDEQSGISKSAVSKKLHHQKTSNTNIQFNGKAFAMLGINQHDDIGGASRFFYTAKASKSEREAGLEGMEVKQISSKGNGLGRTCETCGANTLDGCECENRTYSNPSRLNHHPTVKPIALMRYLVRLVTPKDGTVLDPFMGSGSTGCASMCEEMNFIGIELNDEYVEIAKRRIEHWLMQSSNNTMQQSFDL